MYVNESGHSIVGELSDIHAIMEARYKFNQEAEADKERARQMEGYLRFFKNASELAQNNSSIIKNGLDAQAAAKIGEYVGRALGIGDYQLFRNVHKWYKDSSHSRWGADDVFEAELAKLLQIAGKKALEKIPKNFNYKTDLGVQIIGSLKGNIPSELIDAVAINRTGLNHGSPLYFADTPTAKAIKTDVSGYGGQVIYEANIRPEWQNFINVFAGARFSVKNYRGDSSYNIIHLGNSNIYKSILGTAYDLTGDIDWSKHIFYHSYYGVPRHGGGNHIMHMRFVYELTGAGLVDVDGTPLDAADFFIYNDSTSGNIYVRSTKAMIAEASDYMGNVKDPFNSDVIVLKSKF